LMSSQHCNANVDTMDQGLGALALASQQHQE
jgi:hypothetical protein